MEEIKKQFHKELFDLKKLIAFYIAETKLLRTIDHGEGDSNLEILIELSTALQSFHITKRQFNYNSIIISLYGAFERFVQDMLVTYADFLNRLVVKYNDLPEALIRNHFGLSLSLLNKIQHPRYSGALKKEEVIRNLHTCVNLNENYQLNKDAFAQHSSNFRLQVIDESFSQLGIEGISALIMKSGTFYEYVISMAGKSPEDVITREESFYLLNDLVERRNYVAHGVSSEILQNSILLDYVNFFEVYAEALTEVLNSEYYQEEISHSGKRLGEITDVYNDGTVICIHSNRTALKTGDVLIGRNQFTIVKSRVLGLQLDDKNIELADDQNDYELGVKLERKFRKNFEVFLVPEN